MFAYEKNNIYLYVIRSEFSFSIKVTFLVHIDNFIVLRLFVYTCVVLVNTYHFSFLLVLCVLNVGFTNGKIIF